MGKLRAPVLFAWIACLLVGIVSFVSVGIFLPLRTPTDRPLNLAAEGLFELLPLLFVLTGALIITRHPRHVIGWLLLAPGLLMVAATGINLYLLRFADEAPPPTLLHLLMVLFTGSIWVALIFPLLLIPLLYPTGRPLTPRWRWPVYLAGAMVLIFFIWAAGSPTYQPENASWVMANPYGFLPERFEQFFMPIWSLLLLILTVASLSAVVVRYRRAAPVERAQMKWLLYAVSMFGIIYGPAVLLGSLEGTGISLLDDLLNLMFALSAAGIPAAIGIAILRYHLFDINVIIRLTLLYALVTGMLGLFYTGGIVLLQEIFRTRTGQVSDMAIVVSTLAAASLFNPLRRRLQAVIDRRFFRQKYNAEQTLAEFANTARSSADLELLTAMLVDTAQKSLQPTQISLYLHPREEKEV